MNTMIFIFFINIILRSKTTDNMVNDIHVGLQIHIQVEGVKKVNCETFSYSTQSKNVKCLNASLRWHLIYEPLQADCNKHPPDPVTSAAIKLTMCSLPSLQHPGLQQVETCPGHRRFSPQQEVPEVEPLTLFPLHWSSGQFL